MSQGDDLYYLFAKAQLLLDDGDNRFFQQYALGRTRYYVLLHVSQTPQLSQNELSQRLLCTKGNTARIVKRMEQEGLLCRDVDAQDARTRNLRVTARGAALLAEVRAAYSALNEQRFGCLNGLEKGSLAQNLATLSTHLEELLSV